MSRQTEYLIIKIIWYLVAFAFVALFVSWFTIYLGHDSKGAALLGLIVGIVFVGIIDGRVSILLKGVFKR